MPKYRFTARTAKGSKVRGRLDAPDRVTAIREIEHRSGTPVQIDEEQEARPDTPGPISRPPRSVRLRAARQWVLLAVAIALLVMLNRMHPARPVLYGRDRVPGTPDKVLAVQHTGLRKSDIKGDALKSHASPDDSSSRRVRQATRQAAESSSSVPESNVMSTRPRVVRRSKSPQQPTVDLVAADLAKTARNDSEKAAAIYYWLTRYMSYDRKAEKGGPRPDQAPEAVLQTGKAVCEGYARLFKELGSAMGLRVEIVKGLSKRYPRTETDNPSPHAQHAWNAVLIDGAWRLFDSTWGASGAPVHELSVTERQEYYYQTPPEQLAYSHRPTDPKWQFGSARLSRQEFLELPHLRPSFFVDGLELMGPQNPVITSSGDAVVRLRVPETVEVRARLLRDDGRASIGQPLVLRNDPQCEIRVDPLHAGFYLLRIYTRPSGKNSRFRCSLDYIIQRTPK